MRLFNTAAKTMRIYTEWMTGDVAWSMQVRSLSPDLVLDTTHAESFLG
jgi:hypothetical protein